MKLQHNLPAVNAHRLLGMNQTSTSKSLEKLSSGYRVNRAADDASGLAVSEKMRGQIRGLSMAAQNARHGIDLIKTAEGGLNETHSILQRLRELAVQSSNGTYQDGVDRANLEKEYQSLKGEIDRVAWSTHYNGIKLLNGDRSKTGGTYASPFGAGAGGAPGLVEMSGSSAGITAGQSPGGITGAGSVDWSGINGDLTWLRDKIASTYAPAAIGAILDTYSSLAFLKGSAIGLGLAHYEMGGSQAGLASYHIRYVTKPDGTLKNQSLALSVRFDTGFLASYADQNGFIGPDGETEFYEILTHELTHAVMYAPLAHGMAKDQFPSWYKEGMAQASSGDYGWLDSLGPASPDAAIKSILSGGGTYNAGYLAVMYLGYKAAGGGAVNSAAIASGLDAVMGGVVNGKSLNQSFIDNVGLDVSGFWADARAGGAEICQFVRDLMAAVGPDGGGSVLVPLDTVTLPWASAPTGETYLKIDPDSIGVTNEYPDEYVLYAGGGNTTPGTPIWGNGAPPQPPGPPPPPPPPNPPSQPPQPPAPPGPGSAVSSGKGLVLQIGANGAADQRVTVYIENMDSAHIGALDAAGNVVKSLGSTSIALRDSANAAISVIDAAINQVSGQRAALGAMQNRLEHTLNHLGVAAENLSAAESSIRDVDMAKEMMAFTKNNILLQASQSMLAQANQLPQGVLSLLR